MKKPGCGYYLGEWVYATPIRDEDLVRVQYTDGTIDHVPLPGFGLAPPYWSKNKARQFGTPKRKTAVQEMPCLVCSSTPSDPAHVTSRGAGGTYRDIVPLCRKHHDEQHLLGIESFKEKYPWLDMEAEARRLASKLDLLYPVILEW